MAAASFPNPLLNTQKVELAPKIYLVQCLVAGNFLYKPRDEATPYSQACQIGDEYTVDGRAIEWIAQDPLTAAALFSFQTGLVIRGKGRFDSNGFLQVGALGSNNTTFAQTANGLLASGELTVTAAGSFPIDLALDAIAEVIITFGGSGQILEITGIHQPPSAALTGNVEIWEQAAETNLVFSKALAVTDQELITAPIQVAPGNILELNVTAAGAAGTRLRVSAHQVS